VGDRQVLFDCGMFQGLKEIRQRNWQPMPFKAESLDAVVLTHAHLDHCGLLPRLVGQGFGGRVFCTAGTADLAKIVLADAAHIQEEDAERANRKGYTKHKPALPLFTAQDAARAIMQLQPAGYERALPVAPGITVEFLNAGHLLGSSFVRARIDETDTTVVFGGDLGRYNRPVLPDPQSIDAADVLLLESTYGDRQHHVSDEGEQMAEIITRTIGRGGKVIIPAFALGRVEELIYWIDRLEEEKRIPEVPVYVDSPMARRALTEYRKRIDELDPELQGAEGAHGDRLRAERRVCAFCTSKMKVVESIPESRAVQESKEPAIIISSSGMATGGRVLHHLVRALPEDRNTVLFAGYQAAGTRGRQMREGAKFTRIHGQQVPVRAEIDSLGSLSAHADSDEIMRWLGGFKAAPKVTFLVHGEPGPMDTLKARIERELGWNVRTPEHGETQEI
jgi:metallo-beta-lactamase family protein